MTLSAQTTITRGAGDPQAVYLHSSPTPPRSPHTYIMAVPEGAAIK